MANWVRADVDGAPFRARTLTSQISPARGCQVMRVKIKMGKNDTSDMSNSSPCPCPPSLTLVTTPLLFALPALRFALPLRLDYEPISDPRTRQRGLTYFSMVKDDDCFCTSAGLRCDHPTVCGSKCTHLEGLL